MKIVIANDHKGLKLKNSLINFLEKKGYEVDNIGTDELASVNYPEYAFKVGKLVSKNESDFGILICGTGIGMSIAANKVKGIRCALVNNSRDAKLTREHNDANVLALSSNLSFYTTKKIVLTFLQTNFSNDERHLNRINLIKDYEENKNA